MFELTQQTFQRKFVQGICLNLVLLPFVFKVKSPQNLLVVSDGIWGISSLQPTTAIEKRAFWIISTKLEAGKIYKAQQRWRHSCIKGSKKEKECAKKLRRYGDINRS